MCIIGQVTATPGGDTCSGTNGSCSSKNCTNGKVCAGAQGTQWCGCYDPTPTPIKYSCNKTTGGCEQDANGTQTGADCLASCTKNTPTKTPTKTPTSTPVPNCASKGGSCFYSSCNYYSNGLCAVSGGTCNAGYACCKTCPTNTPTNTPQPNTSPTAIPSPQASCAPNAQACIGNDLYHCQYYNSTTQIWQFSNNCLFSCSATDPYATKCDSSTGVAACCTSPGDYCESDCTNALCPSSACTDGNQCLRCSSSKILFGLKEYDKGVSCVDIKYDKCGCVTLWERCGGTTLQSTCDAQSPGSVPKYDNCSRNFCGAPCGPTPTPGGTGGGSCTPSCSAAASYCLGVGFDDGCGGTCYGSASCTGTINAKAVLVSAADRSCTALAAAATLDGTVLTIDNVYQTQTTGTTLTWTGKATGLYTIAAMPPGQYATGNTCVSQDSGTYAQGTSGTLLTNGTLNFIVGFIPQSGWVQTIGGNAYAGNQLVSSIPTTATNPYFSFAGAMSDAGMVTYGTSYDFSLVSTDLGESNVSTKRWLMQHTNTSVDYYTQFATRMDVPDSATTIENATSVTKPACGTSPCIYYVGGDMTTAAGTAWNIAANEQMIIFASGSVTINSPITITSGGFFALISHNGIYVSSTVGGATGSTAATLEGIYIATNANHTAVFATGGSTTTGTERLVVRGSVIADNFQLFRDLGTTINNTTPAEQFIFNPELLFTMPDNMKEIPYVWQEVAP